LQYKINRRYRVKIRDTVPLYFIMRKICGYVKFCQLESFFHKTCVKNPYTFPMDPDKDTDVLHTHPDLVPDPGEKIFFQGPTDLGEDYF